MFSLINRGRRLLSGAPLQLSPPGRGLGFLEGFSLRAISVSLRWEERGGRVLLESPLRLTPSGRGLGFLERVFLESPLRLTSLGREERARGLGFLVAADAAGAIGIGRLALPALLGVLDNIDILGGGISRLTRGIAPSRWRQPYPLPDWGEMERGRFYL